MPLRKRLLRGAIGLLGLGLAYALLIALALRAPAPLPTPEPGARFSDLTLLEFVAGANPESGERSAAPTRRRASLEIEGTRIARVGSPAARTDDPFAGAFALRGLTDMHAHMPMTGFPGDAEYTGLLYLLHGVTEVRLTGGTAPETATEWNERLARGERAGPHFTTCGPILDGTEPVIPGSRSIATPAEARAVVDDLAERGASCIKAYDGLDLPTVRAMREQAHARGLPIIGHTPQRTHFEDARLDDVQHLRGVHPAFTEDERTNLAFPNYLGAWDRHDDARIADVIAASHQSGIAHTPTLVAIEGHVVARDWERWRRTPTMQLWLPHMRDAFWSGEVGFGPARFSTDAELAMIARARIHMRRTVLALHRAGIAIHTGTDANAPNIVPGASLHRELELLVEAGLSPSEALAASVRTSPTFLGLDRPSQLRRSSPATFALFREDPTQDIAALRTFLAVVQRGRLYTKAELERRLHRHQAHHQAFPYRRILLPSLRLTLRAVTAALANNRNPEPQTSEP